MFFFSERSASIVIPRNRKEEVLGIRSSLRNMDRQPVELAKPWLNFIDDYDNMHSLLNHILFLHYTPSVFLALYCSCSALACRRSVEGFAE